MAEKLALALSVLLFSSLWASTTLAQTCGSYTFASSNQQFSRCSDLPHLNSFLHWTHDSATGQLQMAYRHTGVSSGTWVAWGINPSTAAMPGTQTLVAFPQSGASPRVYKSPIGQGSQGYSTALAEGDLSYNVTGLDATYENQEMIIFATWTLPAGTTTINQVWQAGPLSGSSPGQHGSATENLNSRGALDLTSGTSLSTGGGSSRQRKRNVHGVLNAVSWGILMPVGAVIARYLKVFKSADPAWFYLHVTCQTTAYIVGVAGWGTGLKLGSDSPGVTQNPHRSIGIALFCLGTLQVFALLLRPKKDHKYRLYWNIYHHSVGYAVIALSIANIYEGFDILDLQDKIWKRSYTGVIIGIGAVAVFLEAYTWFIVLKMKKAASKSPYGVNGASNGANGYDSRTHNDV